MNPNGCKTKKISYKRIRKNLYAMSCGVCPVCGKKIQNKNPLDKLSYMTVDHIIPKSKGGRRNYHNIRPMCEQCNQLRGTLDTRQFLDYKSAIRKNLNSHL